ncbi:hypothetical protein EHI8A_089770 [Entamoeba histolytica HM-1:IMSS-B]|uniref:Uncharacterized protein n=6 Tax=Entamoeba histolytica TaxID=5759 RepID=C4M7X6_ENTH1|nr:hypothetical protein EHI_119480 [Entamoeba histolytica HM-1:IMSS]EMD49532.1 Hypothetical protein EHI5A_127950 [Entamoeba histolytica KU27]EMH76027.1 hypothetical protein EHI8A_089770 [Entamoeba histolytica HM-1:IMSS-B]EMS11887.1 hypothetical protein KM1_159200 [Entamoeba histolytica HM-3:IMSS]ENY64820.1 hypothetical protein EHI7A_087150 [Entamoeba histolytica HM-1:IMSS-A]GAT97659.1 hypothetical protein CL6EHI_119480 [Entamoeba histolytica]|eukprot:XP_651469.1 hypothetical protein EHI_119480 [Entamoeba histolytica HM-1:IMSS]
MEEQLPEFSVIQFPGFVKNPNAPFEEKVKPLLDCFGGETVIKNYFQGTTQKLTFSFRPNDKCASTLPVHSEKCKNKLLIRICDKKINVIGIVTKQLSVDSLAPFQVLDRCSLNMLIPAEQSIPSPLEINTVRMTKIEQPNSVDFRTSKEKERIIIETHPYSLPFRKSKVKGKKKQNQTTPNQINEELNE